MSQLTDLRPLSLLLLIFIHWHADCGWLCCWECFQIRQGRELCCILHFQTDPVCVLLKCTPAVSHCLFFLCGFLACWRRYGLDFINCLLQSIDKCSRSKCGLGAAFVLNLAHDVTQLTVVCHHRFASRNSCKSAASPNILPLSDSPAVGESDNVDHHFLSPTTINPLAVHCFTSSLIDLYNKQLSS